MESRVEGEYGGCDGMMIVGDLFLGFLRGTGDFPENSKSRRVYKIFKYGH